MSSTYQHLVLALEYAQLFLYQTRKGGEKLKNQVVANNLSPFWSIQ